MTSLFTIDSVNFFLYQYLSTSSVTNAINSPVISTRYTPSILFKPILFLESAKGNRKDKNMLKEEYCPIA